MLTHIELAIEIGSGTVFACYADAPELRITLIDWDVIAHGDTASRMFPRPLSDMPPETRAAFDRQETVEAPGTSYLTGG